MKKTIYKILIAVLFAIVIFFLLFRTIMMQDKKQKIEMVEVVQLTNDISESEKIRDTDLTLVEVPAAIANNFIKDKSIAVNKYASNDLFIGDLLMESNIKKAAGELKKGERELRIAANLLTAGGLCKGDKVDLIYVNSVDARIYGKEIALGLEIQAILNMNGTDLENVTPDEYNSAILDPAYVVFYVDDSTALKISTLQGTVPNIVFTLNKWNVKDESIKKDGKDTTSIMDILFQEDSSESNPGESEAN